GLASAYTSNLAADPKDPETLWVMGRSIRVSRDGGHTFQFAKGSPGGDDYHALWINPADSRRMIVGADQGAVVTLNGGETWSSWYNQPTGQFYRLGIDDRSPYWIYSGQQDSGTVGIASRSDYGQITFRDWHPVGGDERDGDVPDPKDPAIVYGAGLGGRISRWSERTGQVQNVTPWPVSSYGARPGTGRYRYEWITPLAISPRPPYAMYTAAQVLFRSLDAGRNWETVSPDLTGADPNATGCGVGDAEVPVERATACGFGTIFAVTPSPAADGAIWMGTTNGRVLLTRDNAKTWTAVTPKGLAEWSKINLIDSPARDAATAYVAADRHRLDDFRPMAWRTHDWGATWVEIGHGLPAGAWVGVVRADPVRPGLLYAGTSRGVWVSFDDGGSWRSLQLNLPTTGINDLRVQGNDVVVATQGRAIWILDQVEPLRSVAASPEAGAKLLPPARAYRLRGNQNKDTPLPAEEPRGANPPEGAILDYVLPAGVAGPVTLEILDGSGGIVRRFSSEDKSERPEADVYFTDRFLAEGPTVSTAPGQHRFAYNLRYPRPRALEYEYSIAAVPGKDTAALPEGAFILPGTYRIRLTAGSTVSEQSLEVAMDPRVEPSREPLAQLLDFQRKVGEALSRSTDLEAERRRTVRLLEAAKDDPKAKSLAKSVAQRKAEIERLTAKSEDDPAKINANLASLATDLESVDAPPTAPQRELLEAGAKGIARFDTAWSAFLAGPFAELRVRLEKSGVKSADK
ncbi:MAG TPA: glycoside hydrolase, partial [Verrucomicrobiae bacterium]|nr:glycoside hydrolase [Verrucomicrobiae bacterium]